MRFYVVMKERLNKMLNEPFILFPGNENLVVSIY